MFISFIKCLNNNILIRLSKILLTQTDIIIGNWLDVVLRLRKFSISTKIIKSLSCVKQSASLEKVALRPLQSRVI